MLRDLPLLDGGSTALIVTVVLQEHQEKQPQFVSTIGVVHKEQTQQMKGLTEKEKTTVQLMA